MTAKPHKMNLEWTSKEDKHGLYLEGKCVVGNFEFGVFSITEGVDENGKPDGDKIYHRLIFNPWRTHEDQFCIAKVEYGKAMFSEIRLKDVALGWACGKLSLKEWDFAYGYPKQQTSKEGGQ